MIDRENMEDVVVLHPQKTREIIEKSQFIGNGVVGLINRVRETGVSSVFFLDKSARPLAWMFRKIWKGLANKGLIPEEENIPEIRFINIGRDQDQENFKPDSEAIRLAKEKYVLPPGGPILIVDEYSETAETLGRARDVVQEIFPDRELIEYTAYGSLLPWYGISEIIGVGGDLVSETGEKKGVNRVWVFPLSRTNTINGVKPVDRGQHLAFRKLLNSKIVTPAIENAVKTKEGKILIPDLSVKFDEKVRDNGPVGER